MRDEQEKKELETKVQRVKLTARITLPAYDAIFELQRQHRRKTGKHLPLWKVLDAAVRTYAHQQGFEVEE
jgi:hypothetical protein